MFYDLTLFSGAAATQSCKECEDVVIIISINIISHQHTLLQENPSSICTIKDLRYALEAKWAKLDAEVIRKMVVNKAVDFSLSLHLFQRIDCL